MEYKQSYDNDLNILTIQLNKILLEKKYEEHIKPYKDSAALVKMIYKKNEHLFEEYKDIPDLEDKNKNRLDSLNKNQIRSLLNIVEIIKDPNQIKNIVNPEDGYFYKELIESNPLKPSSIENNIHNFMISINNGEQRLKIKQMILEIAEKAYPDTKSENAHNHFSHNHTVNIFDN